MDDISYELQEQLKSYKSICWYPSAGTDLHGMLYLTPQYLKTQGWEEKQLPDCFIFTDCDDWAVKGFLKNGSINAVLHQDKRTSIVAENLELAGELKLPYDERLILLPSKDMFGSVFYSRIKIQSNVFGEWETDFFYIITENTAFATQFLIPNSIHVDYVTRIRYGGGFGGSFVSGEHIRLLLNALHTRYFICDSGRLEYFPRDMRLEGFREEFAEYFGHMREPEYFQMSEDNHQWSSYDSCTWYKVKSTDECEWLYRPNSSDINVAINRIRNHIKSNLTDGSRTIRRQDNGSGVMRRVSRENDCDPVSLLVIIDAPPACTDGKDDFRRTVVNRLRRAFVSGTDINIVDINNIEKNSDETHGDAILRYMRNKDQALVLIITHEGTATDFTIKNLYCRNADPWFIVYGNEEALSVTKGFENIACRSFPRKRAFNVGKIGRAPLREY